MNVYNRTSRDDLIWQLMLNTKYTEEALEKMTDKELLEMYRVHVERD